MLLWIAAWIVSAAGAWLMWADWWRDELDIDIQSASIHGLLFAVSGPIGLLAMSLLWGMRALPENTERVLWKRK